MIPILLSFVFGAGIYLIYEGLTNPRLEPGEARRLKGVEESLARAGLHDVTPGDFVLFSLGAGAVAGVVAQLLLGWAAVSLLAAALGAATPFVYYLQRHDRRQAALQIALVEAIEQLRDAIRAGFSVQEALGGLARTGPEVLRPEFATLVRDMRLDGFEPAMGALRARFADPLVDIVTGSLTLNDRLGGHNVTQVLDRLAHATRAQLRIQQEIRAYQARNVLAARIVAAVPLAVLVAIRQVSPRYLEVFDTPPGQLILAGCVLSVVVGYLGMLWMTRLPGERRVVR